MKNYFINCTSRPRTTELLINDLKYQLRYIMVDFDIKDNEDYIK